MTIRFINNYTESVALAVDQTSATLALPDGKYRLTLADSSSAPTRWEILDAVVAGGAATLDRAKEGTSAQEWPSGSIIYNALTAETLNSMLADIQSLKPVEPAGLFTIEVAIDQDATMFAYFGVGSTDPSATVDMGDGTVYNLSDSNTGFSELFHEYSKAGIYTVVINGDYDKVKISTGIPYKIMGWGSPMPTSPAFEFSGSIKKLPSILPSWVTNLSEMLAYSSGFSQDLSGWNTSNVVAMDEFAWESDFNGDISTWTLESLITASRAFYNNTAFNQDLSGWCVPLIASEPADFSTGATAWVLPKPAWGTCPS